MFDKDTINTIVQAAVVQALGGEEAGSKLLKEVVDRLVSTKVHSNGGGHGDRYGGSPSTPLLQFLVDREVRNVLEKAVIQFVENNSAEIGENVKLALVADEGIAKSISDLLSNQLRYGSLSVNVSFKPE